MAKAETEAREEEMITRGKKQTITQRLGDESLPLAFCLTCGECLGENRLYFAKEHLSKFPDHISKGFLIKTIKDPLKMTDSELKVHLATIQNGLSMTVGQSGYFSEI